MQFLERKTLVFLVLISFCCSACNEDVPVYEKLAGLRFPMDCTSSLASASYISDDWPIEAFPTSTDTIFWSQLQIYFPNAYLIKPEATGLDKLFVNIHGVDTISSWTITNSAGLEILSHQNFPPNDPDYGWDGLTMGNTEDGLYFSRITFQSPNGEENFIEGHFCGFHCGQSNITAYSNNGMDFTGALWSTISHLLPFTSESWFSLECE